MTDRLMSYIDEGGFDPWKALGIGVGSYSAEQDDNAIAILECIAERGVYIDQIADRTGLSKAHIELWQYIFCSAAWCEYGTSPRGCFPIDDEKFAKCIADWKVYREVSWGDGSEIEQITPKERSDEPE